MYECTGNTLPPRPADEAKAEQALQRSLVRLHHSRARLQPALQARFIERVPVVRCGTGEAGEALTLFGLYLLEKGKQRIT